MGVEERLEEEDARTRLQVARGTFDRILGTPPQTCTSDADTDTPLSIVIEEVALRVAGNGDGASA